ncbi:MAG TPA: hypothetical protein VFD82_24810 [Planctomycetota bacterium]|nr:hypothetical protein [Planctomycetota bacterium]
MGLGLTLRARAREPEPLAAIEQFVEAQYEDFVAYSRRDDKQYLVQLHPAAENVEFTFDDGVVTVSAKTSTVGPGSTRSSAGCCSNSVSSGARTATRATRPATSRPAIATLSRP